MLAIGCEKSVCHLVQTIGFNAETFVPRAEGFLKDTKLPFKLLKLGHLPCSGNSESYVIVGTISINKQFPSHETKNRVFAESYCLQPLTNFSSREAPGKVKGKKGGGLQSGCGGRGDPCITENLGFHRFCS